MSDRDSKRPMVRVGGLWKKQIRGSRKTFLSGNLGQAVMFVFPQDKEKDTDPDYAIFVAPNEPREGEGSERGRRPRDPDNDRPSSRGRDRDNDRPRARGDEGDL